MKTFFASGRTLGVFAGSGEAAAGMELETRVGPLLDWYQVAARDLPWRRSRDPYAIWVSEIMLQQTQVRTVLKYWERWMRALPSVRDLAAAPEEQVLKLWEGLGYYRRARHLQAAARQVMEKDGGVFPSTLDELLELPGVGRYTAGAIHSIAFNQPSPILDGNVIRVLSRWTASHRNPALPAVQKELWDGARRLVEEAARSGRPQACSHLNQSLMELGATVCLPRQPLCARCPVSTGCQGRASGTPERFPPPAARPVAEPREYLVWIARRSGLVAVRQRPAGEVNGGFWEFPNSETTGSVPDVKALARTQFHVGFQEPVRWGDVRHAITRYRIRQTAYVVELTAASHVPADWQWRAPESLRELALTTAHRRLATGLQQLQFNASVPGTPSARCSPEVRVRPALRGSTRKASQRAAKR